MSGLNYREGMDVGKVIDLEGQPSRPFEEAKNSPKPESYLPKLAEQLAAMASRLRTEYGDFFTDSGQIRMEGEDLQKDLQVIADKEKVWAAEVFKDEKTWRTDRAKTAPAIAEQALTLLFDKEMKGDFIIVRASVYDDYKGADQLIIGKDGTVVCGLDDVLGNKGDDGGAIKQEDMAKRMATKGGARIKYGLSFKDGRLERQTLERVPLFYFSLSKKELTEILVDLDSESSAISEKSEKVLAKLLNSLAAQFQAYRDNPKLSKDTQTNLEKFRPSLEKMLSYVQQ